VDMFFANEPYTQLIGRLARQGQKEIVRVIHLCASGTYDSQVIDALNDKETGQQKLLLWIKQLRDRMDGRALE
jgi:SNF2 family DNA or RNA helicase